jgi:hypothetical protein
MRMLLTISLITFIIACGPDQERDGMNSNSSSSSSSLNYPSSSSGQETKSYAVTTDNGESCNVMIRGPYGYSCCEFTLQCPTGTKIGCMRTYDNSKFILCTKTGYVLTSSYGLLGADGYGNGTIACLSNFESIASVSLHETTCN